MHRVILGGGAQVLYHRPGREAAGIITSATYRIVDLHRIEGDTLREVVAAGTAASTSAVSTTITATAGHAAADPAVLTVASATGIAAGRSYLLRSSSHLTEVVEVESISGTTIRLARPVSKTFASGAALLGYELAATFPADAANDESEFDGGRTLFAVDWTFDGRTTRELVTMTRTASRCPVTGADLVRRVRSLASRIGADRDADDFVAASWLAVRAELQRALIDPDTVTTDEALAAAVCYHAAVEIFNDHTDDQSDRQAELYLGRYRDAIGGLTTGAQKPGTEYVSREGAVTPPQERRRITLAR